MQPTSPAGKSSIARAPVERGGTARKPEDGREREQDALVDVEGDQSFPASDPPGWTLGVH